MLEAGLDFTSEAIQAFGAMCRTGQDGVVDYTDFLQWCEAEEVGGGAMRGASSAPPRAAPSLGLAAGPQCGIRNLRACGQLSVHGATLPSPRQHSFHNSKALES